jgi:hypothetical protein
MHIAREEKNDQQQTNKQAEHAVAMEENMGMGSYGWGLVLTEAA